ncbi:hypothetical protein [Bradyrhizobium sp. USDA 3397]
MNKNRSWSSRRDETHRSRIASLRMLPENFPVVSGAELPCQFGGWHGREISMRARRKITSALAERYRAGGRREEGRIFEKRCAVTGASQASDPGTLSGRIIGIAPLRRRGRTYRSSIRDALIAMWDASDRLCSKRLLAMIPLLLREIEQHGRLTLSAEERSLVWKASAATIDRLLSEVRIAAAGGRRRRAGVLECGTAPGPGALVR